MAAGEEEVHDVAAVETDRGRLRASPRRRKQSSTQTTEPLTSQELIPSAPPAEEAPPPLAEPPPEPVPPPPVVLDSEVPPHAPLVRGEWRALFAEACYPVLGLRRDTARDDLLTESGEAAGMLGTRPSIRWLLAVGGRVPLADNLDLALRLEYRFRYYDSRDGEPFAGQIEHGTQNVGMFVGVSWALGESATP